MPVSKGSTAISSCSSARITRGVAGTGRRFQRQMRGQHRQIREVGGELPASGLFVRRAYGLQNALAEDPTMRVCLEADEDVCRTCQSVASRAHRTSTRRAIAGAGTVEVEPPRNASASPELLVKVSGTEYDYDLSTLRTASDPRYRFNGRAVTLASAR